MKVYIFHLSGVKVLTIEAKDKDAGNNGSVKFRLVQSSVKPATYPTSQYPFFAIDENGAVTTLAKFDRERVDRYTLEVIAYDAGTPQPKSGNCKCHSCSLYFLRFKSSKLCLLHGGFGFVEPW